MNEKVKVIKVELKQEYGECNNQLKENMDVEEQKHIILKM